MFTKTEIWTVGKTPNGLAVLLRLPDSSRCVPVYLENSEAQDVLAAISGIKENIPGIYEAFISFSSASAVQPEAIEILKAKSPGYYRAMVHFKSSGSKFTLELKTPDAIILGTRAGIPIFIEDSISEEDSINVTMAETDQPFASQLSRLRKELESVVEEENYEEAVKIRDRINQIEKRIQDNKKDIERK